MGFSGDLRTVNLGDLLQSMASRQHTGMLEVQTDHGKWLISLLKGAIVGLISDPPRDIWKRLVVSGALKEAQVEEARRRRRGGKSLARALLDQKVISAARLRGYFEELAYEQFHEVFTLERGELRLEDRTFISDKNWAALELSLAVPTVLMECARRADQWEVIRRHVPGPGTVLVVDPRARKELASYEGNEIARAILERAGPHQSIGDIADQLPYSRMEAFSQAMALVKHGVLRPAGADELLQIAENAEDPAGVVNTLLQAHREEPANVTVLTELVTALERNGRTKDAGNYLKVLGNVHLEAGREEEAIPCLRRAWEYDTHDPSPAQKLFGLLLKRNDLGEAEEVGTSLAARFRELGHNEAWRDTANELVARIGARADLLADLSQAELARGQRRKGTRLLEQAGYAYLKVKQHEEAEECFRQLARIMPKSKRIRQILEAVRKGTVEGQRRRRSRLVRIGCAIAVAVGFVFFSGYEAHARAKFLTITCDLVGEGLETEADLEKAVGKVETFTASYPGTIVSLVDARRVLEKLETRRGTLPPGAPRTEPPETEGAGGFKVTP
jgi:tetratricopeptide (TPR) repeat protein